MPDQQRHRGAHPRDKFLFAPERIPLLRAAVSDFSWLLERAYASKSALELVGNRFQLHERQRMAVLRSSCAETAKIERQKRCFAPEFVREKTVNLDGYNILTITESALAGGAVFVGRDGCLRDIASLHGTFRRVEETEPAIRLIGEFLEEFGAQTVVWWLDSPVSNSGRLKANLLNIAYANGWNWEARTVFNPDVELMKIAAPELVVSADSVILDAPVSWVNLGRELVARRVPSAWIIDLEEGERGNL